ncbi:NUDIX hydrolase [Knoellia koreensis]|jgi:ADP-ribose pyrophosphatase YjhB (NUDIX family)|uniref:NUDIX hydrolase n=1 Tax=Knoellia koreensis TaxID=2730921 RepID=A0A849HEI0_9MICO|nr:NUDIX hydrolase [Knoellia sp. DB2414S]NNM45024.1 NUDIX hydrolase [Knoellia sp. DB2414S]
MVSREIGYIEGLRRHVGHAPVIMACAGCAVMDDSGRVLLQRRGDAEQTWGLPGGAMELGETLEQTAVRETREETGLDVRPQELLGVYTGPLHTYANGDVVQSVVVMLIATQVGGSLSVDGSETVQLDWFDLDELPSPLFGPHQPMLGDLKDGRRGRWV